jgi:hypothetical protein
MHNAPFDLAVIHRLAPGLKIHDWIDGRRVWDTLLLHRGLRLATTGETASRKGESTLEACAREYLGYRIPKDVVDALGNDVRTSYGRWLGRPLTEIEDIYLTYLATDAVATYRVFGALIDHLRHATQRPDVWGFVSRDWLDQCLHRWGPQTHHLQLQAAIVLREVERRGIRIDSSSRDRLRDELEAVVAQQRDLMAREHNYRPGTKGCDARIQAIIEETAREIEGLDLGRTPTGQFRATREVIEDLCEYSPFFHHLHIHRVASKLLSTYVDRLGDASEVCLHPAYDVLKATGRTSCFGEINAQNLPKDGRIRRCFVPRPGRVFVDLDYKAIELVTLAQACRTQFGLQSRMAEMINQGKDLHRMIAARLFQIPEDAVVDDQRFRAKAVNFGLPGGMGVRSFQAKLRLDVKHSDLPPGRKEELLAWATQENCKKAIDAWFDEWPEMRRFLGKEESKTEDDLFAKVAEFFELTPERYHDATGRWIRVAGRQQPAAWLGGMMVKVLKTEGTPETQKGEAYGPDQMRFFWESADRKLSLLPAKARRLIEARRSGLPLFLAVRNQLDQSGVYTLTGRLRAGTGYCARHNTIFQGLAADGAKWALWLIWRDGYAISNFVHDQVVVELDANQDLRPHIARLKELMIAGMHEVIPDVRIDVESIVSTSWAKQDRVELDEDGRPLIV